MKTYVVPSFARLADKARLPGAALLDAVSRAEAGLVDADLGAGLIKQRIARTGQGRRGGYRSIIVYRRGMLAIFLHLFAKSDQENLSPAETEHYRKAAGLFARLTEDELQRLASERGWRRIDAKAIGGTLPE